MRVFKLWLIILKDKLTYRGELRADVLLSSGLQPQELKLAQGN